ncbi:MAG: family 16 glycosylhydrolase [Clostridia bacterium]|nr:family 16 glycosylhydrolase [Clostridia bacterium]
MVGKTNRSESDKSLKDSDLKVSIVGEKLVFDGGHDVTVDLAVKKFLKLSQSARGVATFSETTDFTSTIADGYSYVWGDEFEVDGLDKNKWSDQNTKMTGGEVLKVGSNANTLSVKNGAMKLTAYKGTDGNYYVPPSVHTQSTMNFKHGYVEMKAKLSLEVGSFASFWTRSISDSPEAAIAPSMQLDHFFEVDMFEVFQKNGRQSIGGNILINSNTPSKNWYPTAMPYTQQLVVPDEEYHTFGYEWTPTEIKLYFDGRMYARFDMSSPWTGKRTAGKGISGWDQELRPDNTGTNLVSFQEHQYLIFNHHLHIAVDDGKGGKKGFLASTSVTENTGFSKADYVIDYVRLYQKSGQSVYKK